MTTFLRDFLHKDRDQVEELDIVIINKYVLHRSLILIDVVFAL